MGVSCLSYDGLMANDGFGWLRYLLSVRMFTYL